MTVYRRPDPIPLRPTQPRADHTHLLSVRSDSEDLNRLVARRIFQAIVDGRFSSGSILPNEHELSTELGVSRTALREAIKGLSAKGIVETRRKRGTLVLEQNEWNMLDAEIVSWSRRTGFERVSNELWDVVRITLPQLAAEAAQRRSSGRLPEIALAFEAATSQSERTQAAILTVLEVAGLSGNRFLYSMTSKAIGNLQAEDETRLCGFGDRFLAGDITALAEHVTSGDGQGAASVVLNLFSDAQRTSDPRTAQAETENAFQ